MNAKRLFVPVLAFFAAAAALGLTGCSLGYTSLHPGENSGLYQHLFEDVITTYDEPYWLWIRGTIAGDFDGSGVVSEEAVIATIQQGDERRPGPVEKAFLVLCDVGEDGTRRAVARTLLFGSDPIPDAPKPVNDLGIVTEQPFTRVRAQMVQDKVSLKESVVVYFYGDTMPSSVWYAGYILDDSGILRKNFESSFYQTTPGFLTANLDRSIDASPFGYQLLFGVAAIPPDIFAKLGPPHETPLWGHVYARDAEGTYRQADERFGQHYRQLENSWNQIYLKALMEELPAHELAWFEYHMALLNHYTGNADMAGRFLAKASEHAADTVLSEAIGQAALLLESRGGEPPAAP